MSTSKKLAEKGLEPLQENTPKTKKPCRIDGKTVIWIDRDADEKEAIQKYLTDRQNSQRLYDRWRSHG